MKPTTPGAYWVKSDETGGEWTPVEIVSQNGVLMVDCPFIGIFDLDRYHNGLTDIEWQRDGELP